MFEHKKLFDELKRSRNNIQLHSIHELDSTFFNRSVREKLDAVGLSMQEIIFCVEGESYCDGVLNNGANLGGDVINVETESGIQQVIFIYTPPIDPNIPDDAQDDWQYMLKLISLAHELGHVEDMQLTIKSNFHYSSVNSVNLVEAEGYANAYALNYLHSIGQNTARNTLAGAIYRAHSSKKKFEQQLYSSICSRIGKGRLKKWAA